MIKEWVVRKSKVELDTDCDQDYDMYATLGPVLRMIPLDEASRWEIPLACSHIGNVPLHAMSWTCVDPALTDHITKLCVRTHEGMRESGEGDAHDEEEGDDDNGEGEDTEEDSLSNDEEDDDDDQNEEEDEDDDDEQKEEEEEDDSEEEKEETRPAAGKKRGAPPHKKAVQKSEKAQKTRANSKAKLHLHRVSPRRPGAAVQSVQRDDARETRSTALQRVSQQSPAVSSHVPDLGPCTTFYPGHVRHPVMALQGCVLAQNHLALRPVCVHVCVCRIPVSGQDRKSSGRRFSGS